MRCLAVKVPFSKITLIPICCIHWPLGEKDILHEWVDRIASSPNTYGIMLGDSMDESRTHFRNHIKSYTHDSNSMEAGHAYHKEDIRALAKVIKPAAKRIWGVLRGNHYTEFTDGTNSEQYLCQQLGLDYFGVMGWIRLNTTKGSGNNVVKIFMHHTGGSSGGRTTSGDVAAALRLGNANDADIYVVGHTHRRWGDKEPVLTITSWGEVKPIERTRVFIRSGGLLKGFKKDEPRSDRQHTPSYPECACMSPTDLGFVRCQITWKDAKVFGTSGKNRKERATRVFYEVSW